MRGRRNLTEIIIYLFLFLLERGYSLSYNLRFRILEIYRALIFFIDCDSVG